MGKNNFCLFGTVKDPLNNLIGAVVRIIHLLGEINRHRKIDLRLLKCSAADVLVEQVIFSCIVSRYAPQPNERRYFSASA